MEFKTITKLIRNFGKNHPTYWGCATAGEAGELANVLKKVERDDLKLTEIYDKKELKICNMIMTIKNQLYYGTNTISDKPHHNIVDKEILDQIDAVLELLNPKTVKEAIEEEIAGNFIYLELVARQFNIDLEKCVQSEIAKVNAKQDAKAKPC